MENKTKYIAIKVDSFKHWLWFDKEFVTIENNRFIGHSGWGDGGEYTNIDIPEKLIIGKMESNSLQYR